MAKWKIYVVGLLLAVLALPGLCGNISTQIREGVYQEEVEGDLDAAIKIYEGILAENAENQRYAAQACYRLGLCYLKKGQKDKAIGQFERIVKDYPAEKTTLQKAKSQLKKLKPAGNKLSERDRIIASSYVIHYKTVGTNEDGIRVFNRSHPKGVSTHHAGRYRVKGETISSICTDTAEGKDKIVKMIENNKQLELVKVEEPKMARPSRPMVIDSFPKTYSTDVSADVDKMSVTFDQPMIKGNYSWVRWNWKFPESPKNTKPYYDEKGRTCTKPVKLEPGTAYLIRINARQYSSFMNLDGVRAQPFVLVFATKDKDGKPTPIPEDMLKFAKYINGLNPTSNTAAAENLAAEGWKLWGQRRLAEAERKFKEAIAKDADCENAYQGLGWSQFNQGKSKAARESFSKCIKLNPKNSAALNGLGWVAYSADEKDKAIEWWKKAVEAYPGATASLSGLCKVYMERKDYEKAVTYYKMWLKVEPDNKDAKDGLRKAQGIKGVSSIQEDKDAFEKMDKRSKQSETIIRTE